ncbi:glycerate kinase type-2 family protein [Pseudaestuariivita rosea]|uniref:glycerate kinase type-2 family protein n=1 Tax=Pseudaestuariivita rosea TaxID=2763263 RepID=UPI001ABAFE67|nr:DUF4147 domain-containing protein [Pseudaestuariivita rosea]
MVADLSKQRAVARGVFDAGVACADPYKAVQSALQARPLAGPAPLVIAVGKAAVRMARAAQAVLPAVGDVLIVTNYENATEVPGATVFAAGHPVPDENGAAAADAVCTALSQAQGQVLALISGGGSALLPAPVDGIALAEKAAVNAALLASGADIVTMNLIRQQLSRLKGGGMLRLAAPAQVRALILSDVVGDDLRAIASGPTVAPLGTAEMARATLQDLGLWDQMPASVQAHLGRSVEPQPLPEAENELIGSNALSLNAMAQAAPEAVVFPDPLEGDVSDAAEKVISFAQGPGIYLFGGETTVHLAGDGRGGRNQELALRVALLAEQHGWTDWVYLQGGTDGRDGPTDAAGGLVDAGTLTHARAAGCDVQAMLANNDSYAVLQAADDLLITGATGTNVADLGVLIRWSGGK